MAEEDTGSRDVVSRLLSFDFSIQSSSELFLVVMVSEGEPRSIGSSKLVVASGSSADDADDEGAASRIRIVLKAQASAACGRRNDDGRTSSATTGSTSQSVGTERIQKVFMLTILADAYTVPVLSL